MTIQPMDRITAVTHFIPGTPSAHPLATTGYAYDALHRRQSATDLDGVAWNYDYNDRGEIDTARRQSPLPPRPAQRSQRAPAVSASVLAMLPPAPASGRRRALRQLENRNPRWPAGGPGFRVRP